ncbi:MAG TPA: FtsK/SpoIIIE domain-containing protein [Flavobacterium sp.]|nr:FtsK/SpoIIIE domain-containing protein [Flavobacterium sp.]
MAKKDNFLDEWINPLKHSIRTRKGLTILGREFKEIKVLGKTLHLDNEIPGIILDVFDNLGFTTKDNRKPQIVAKSRTDYGWHLVINLPPGISFSKCKRFQDYFSDAVKGFVVMEWNGALHMDIQTNTLPSFIPYKWDATPYLDKLTLPVPIGYTQKGIEVFDLTDAPHMFIAGQTGMGKSNLLHIIANALLMLPNIKLCICDPKRLDFRYLKDRVLLARDENEIYNLFKALNKEHDRRVKLIEKESDEIVKIQEYEGELDYIVVMIDEWAELDKETQPLINRILRLSRALGISIIGATQRPSVKVFGDSGGDSRDLFEARVCYKVGSEISSRMVLGEEYSMAAWLPAIKGRAIWKFGHEIKEVQTMFLSKKDRQKLAKEQEARRWDIELSTKRLSPR